MTPTFRIALLSSSSLTPLSTGEVLYTTAGSYTFTAQYTGAHWVCCQGPGGGGASSASDAGGGGGGANAWARFDMVQGQTATVVVGVPGAAQTGTAAGNDATDSSFTISGSIYLIAEGGEGGKLSNIQTGQASFSALGYVGSPGAGLGGRGGRGYPGGAGGGGGAGSPGGAGGDGGDPVVDNAENGTGGGAGGGGQGTGAGQSGGGGGGVGFLSAGASGTGGAAGDGGTGGSGGTAGQGAGGSPVSDGGLYGGGGGGGDGRGGLGGGGYVRIIWGAGRSWPSNAAAVPLLASFDFRANKARLSGIRYPNLAAAITNKVVDFYRASAATALSSDGTLQSFSSGQPRITDLGFLAEEGRTNLCPYSANDPGLTAAGTTPPTINNDVTVDGIRCVAVTLPTGAGGYGDSRATGTGFVLSAVPYTQSCVVKLSRPLTGSEAVLVYVTGNTAIAGANLTSSTPNGVFFPVSGTATAAAGVHFFAIIPVGTLTSPITIWVGRRQIEAGSFALSHVPTSGAAAPRAADNLSAPYVLPSGDHDIAVRWKNDRTPPQTIRLIEMHDGTDNNRVYVTQNSSGVVKAYVTNSGVDTQIGSDSSALTGAREISVLIERRSGNWTLKVDGPQVGSATAASAPTITALGAGYRRNSSEYANTYIQSWGVTPL